MLTFDSNAQAMVKKLDFDESGGGGSAIADAAGAAGGDSGMMMGGFNGSIAPGPLGESIDVQGITSMLLLMEFWFVSQVETSLFKS